MPGAGVEPAIFRYLRCRVKLPYESDTLAI